MKGNVKEKKSRIGSKNREYDVCISVKLKIKK